MMDREGLEFIEEPLNAPLPNEVPEPTRQMGEFSKSRTVQSLLSQNQDLMARLTVALKRNIELEQRLDKSQLQIETVQADFDVYKDSTRFFKEKISRLEYDLNETLMDKSESEKQFAEVYTDLQEKTFKNLILEKKVSILSRFHKRIQSFVRPMVDTLKAEIFELNQDMKAQEEKIIRQEDILTDVRKRMAEAVDHIQKQKKEADADQQNLVQTYENRHRQICEELGSAKNQIETLEQSSGQLRTDKTNLERQILDLKTNFETQVRIIKEQQEDKIQKISETSIDLQNKVVMYERRYEEIKLDYETRIQEHSALRTSTNSQINNLELKWKATVDALKEQTQLAQNYEKNRNQLQDQLDSLQLIFDDHVKKLDELKTKYTSTDKINKELSEKMTEQRKENERLKNEITNSEESFKSRLNNFGQRIFQERQTNLELKEKMESSKVPGEQKELLSRIQILLSEIQSGYDVSEEPEKLVSEQGEIEN